MDRERGPNQNGVSAQCSRLSQTPTRSRLRGSGALPSKTPCLNETLAKEIINPLPVGGKIVSAKDRIWAV